MSQATANSITARRGLTPAFQQRLGEAIEGLIALLDEIQGDPDLEDGHDAGPSGDEDEPSIGSAQEGPQAFWAYGGTDDLEGGDADAEPILASPERHGSQAHWADGARSVRKDDCEEENEHGGDIQDEPHDGELDLREGCDLGGEDNGIGDRDGLEEQAGQRLPYEEAEKVRAAGREAAEALRTLQRRNGQAPARDGGEVRIVGFRGADGSFRRV